MRTMGDPRREDGPREEPGDEEFVVAVDGSDGEREARRPDEDRASALPTPLTVAAENFDDDCVRGELSAAMVATSPTDGARARRPPWMLTRRREIDADGATPPSLSMPSW